MALKEKDVRIVPETGSYRRAVGVFKHKADVEHAIRALKDSSYDMNRVSLLARDIDDVKGSKEVTEHTGNEAAEGAGAGATTGTVLGGVTGFLIGVGVLAIPGIGPVLAAGAEISAIASTLAGAGIGAAAGGIVGALVGMGIPEERAKVYESRLNAGHYLLIVSGGVDNDLKNAESIMRARDVEEFEIFDASNHERHDVVDRHGVKDTVTATEGRGSVNRPGVVTDEQTIAPDTDPNVVIIDKRDHDHSRRL